MHKLGCKTQLFKSNGVLMLGHGCGVSKYPQFYDRIKNIYRILPRPHVGSYSGENSHQFLHKPCILALAQSLEIFVMVLISDMPIVHHWKNLGSFLDKAKDNTPI